jgi:hypothetical protein
VLGAVIAVALASCASEGEKLDPDDVDGYATAVLALTSQSDDGFLETARMAGSILLVDADGSFRAVETAGMNFASLSFLDGVVHASDIHADLRVSKKLVERVDRGFDFYAQEDAVATALGNLTVFNAGVGEAGDYHSPLLLDTGDIILMGELTGELWNVAACGEEVRALVSSWEKPGEDLRLERLVVADGELEVERVLDVDLPRGDPDLAWLGCSGDTWYLHLDLGPKRGYHVGEFDLNGELDWTRLDLPSHPDWGVQTCGLHDGALAYLDREVGTLNLVEVDTGKGTVLMELPVPDDASSSRVEHGCAHEDGVFRIDVQDGSYGDPTYYWYGSDGMLLRELTVNGLGTFLRENGESVTDAGVTLDVTELLNADRSSG